MNIRVVRKQPGDLAILLQSPVPLAGLGVVIGGFKKVRLSTTDKKASKVSKIGQRDFRGWVGKRLAFGAGL